MRAIHYAGHVRIVRGHTVTTINHPRRGGTPVCGDVAKLAAKKAAKGFVGYGTGLKPAYEVIIVARKPLSKTVARNVLKHGCGALAIDASRVGGGKSGRWPSNVILDDAAATVLDAQSGNRKGMSGGGRHKPGSPGGMFGAIDCEHTARGDSGGASRFFYCPKASQEERDAGCEEVLTWERVDLSQETEALLQQARDTSGDTMRLLGDSEWSTSLSGRLPTAQSRKDFRSTIATASSLITALKTSSCSQHSSTSASILAATRTIAAHGSSHANLAASIEKLSRDSTDVPTGTTLSVVSALLLVLSEISRKGRNSNAHKTVKPIDLARYLARLILPPVADSRLLVPFCGSGSEMIGAMQAGWSHVEGIDSWDGALDIARARLEHWKLRRVPVERVTPKPTKKPAKVDPRQTSLFALFDTIPAPASTADSQTTDSTADTPDSDTPDEAAQ